MKTFSFPGSKEINNHISYFKNQFNLLQEFSIPNIKTWIIDWKPVKELGASRTWDSQLPFSEFFKNKKLPAVYFFTTLGTSNEELHNASLQCKSECSQIRMSKGVKHTDYYNLSHVPKIFIKTHCLYDRLIGHLGYGANRTGALFVNRVLEKVKYKADIQFTCFFMKPQYQSITEHLERIFQDHFKPLIGAEGFQTIK